VLASYWLKTVCRVEHKRAWWQLMDGLLKQAVREEALDAPSREALVAIQEWMVRSDMVNNPTTEAASPPLQLSRANPPRETMASYLARLLNEWLPAEVARLLIEDTETAIPPEGPSALAIGRAMERLLTREHLSREALEMLLQPELLSPHSVYPADAEMMRDVVLALLGRTEAPVFPVMPAAALAHDLNPMVRHASCGGEEIQVPISEAQAWQILQGAPMHIASILVTADGRWWEPEKLQSGEKHSIVYKPGGRLRIDRSAEHARLSVPWPETRVRWSGAVQLPESVELFAREWRAVSWELDGERAWLNLEFMRVRQQAQERLRRSRPAFVDMAWAALENALALAIAQKSGEPIEHLRRTEFIPLGRALLGLAELLGRHWPPKREAVLRQLRAVRYLEAQLVEEYGRVPWKALPGAVQSNLLKRRDHREIAELVNQVFDEAQTPPLRAA